MRWVYVHREVGSPVHPRALGVANIRDIVDVLLFAPSQLAGPNPTHPASSFSAPNNQSPPTGRPAGSPRPARSPPHPRLENKVRRTGERKQRQKKKRTLTYETVHLPPDDLLPLQPAPPAREEPLAAGDQRPPLRRERAQHAPRLGRLRRRAAEEDAFPYALAQLAGPAPRRRLWYPGRRRQEGAGAGDG